VTGLFSNGNWQYEQIIENKTVKIYSYLGTDETVVVPSTIDGMKVVGIGSTAFGKNIITASAIRRVVISEGIVWLSRNVLTLSAVQEVVLPSTLRRIESNTFENARLESIEVDSHNPVFSARDGVLFRSLPPFVQTIQQFIKRVPSELTLVLFPMAKKTTFYRIPSGTYRIAGGAFKNCIKLKEVEMPDNVVSLGERAFENCFELEKVVLSKNLEELKDKTFTRCPNLSDVRVTARLLNVSGNAFHDCPQFKGINIQTRKPSRKHEQEK
jgi:hypothetical protein